MRRQFTAIPARDIGAVLQAAGRAGLPGAVHNTVQAHDLALLRARIGALAEAFPPDALHGIAIKANPVVALLAEVVATGAGLEAASMEEVECALAAGCPAERIIFDSPAKTRAEIARALALGIVINLDNFDELARVAALLGDRQPSGRIGLRVNPAVGAGNIAITSVSTRESKFGVSLAVDRQRVIDACCRHPWLRGLHVHVGSQGCSLEQLLAAARAIDTLRADIDAASGEPGRIDFVDIGGGLPFPYTSADQEISFAEYATALREAAPALFDAGITLATEFGRVLQAGCGWTATRIEYVKPAQRLAVCHAGADLFMRPVYQPEHWRHRFSLLDANGQPRGEPDAEPWSIAGPLCFAGDLLARDIALPTPREGDWLIVHDTGAYTLSMWSRHCSRGLPPVLGYEGAGDPAPRLLLAGETPADVARFWSAGTDFARR